ncbi:MAG TPA: hypothetical protein VMU05_04715 [Dongiaceae bacterium]|nr:hypothetical protein [Dongiaceae bacterium]
MTAHAARLQMSTWRWAFLLLIAGGAVASLLAKFQTIGAATGLSDSVPWGLCLGLNVFCGIALAAGGLSLAAILAVLNGRNWRTLGRVSLLVGSIGYVVAMLGMVANEAIERHLWTTIIRGWSSRSILSGALWTVLLLTCLLLVEFLPDLSPRLSNTRSFAGLARLKVPLLFGATGLAVLHQLGLDRLIGLAEARFSPLWSGPELSLMFYMSALAGTLAVILFASWRCWLAFDKSLPAPVIPAVARALTITVFLYLLVRFMDLIERGLFTSIFRLSREGLLLLFEIVVLLLGMMWIKGNELNPRELFYGSALIIAGLVANRLNTAITALEANAGQYYLPHWGEFLISYSLIAAGIGAFAMGVEHLTVFSTVDPVS